MAKQRIIGGYTAREVARWLGLYWDLKSGSMGMSVDDSGGRKKGRLNQNPFEIALSIAADLDIAIAALGDDTQSWTWFRVCRIADLHFLEQHLDELSLNDKQRAVVKHFLLDRPSGAWSAVQEMASYLSGGIDVSDV